MTLALFYDTMERWRNDRFAVIEQHYDVSTYFQGKTVLEVAAAWGHIGSRFANQYGATVTCTDYYDKWIQTINTRYPNIRTRIQDLNKPWDFDEFFDVIIHMGVIYHQPPDLVEIRLREAIAHCSEMIIETLAEISDDPMYIARVEPPREFTWEPLDMIVDYSRPSTAFINRILDDCGMTYTMVQYCEPYKDDTHEEARFLWFCKKTITSN
jgi:Methyltransferase domain